MALQIGDNSDENGQKDYFFFILLCVLRSEHRRQLLCAAF